MNLGQLPVEMRRIFSTRFFMEHRHEFKRFLLTRGVCAVFSYGLYLALLLIARYEIAYVVSYAAGIALAYFSSSRFVFQVSMSARSAMRFPIVYLAQFVISFLVLKMAVQFAHTPPSFAYAFAVAVTIPITFSLSRWIMHAG